MPGYCPSLCNIRIDVTDPGPTKQTWCPSLHWFMTIPMSAANFPNVLDVFSKFCDQIMMVFVTNRFVMSSAKMVNDASKMSPVQKHFACKYSASSSTFSQYLSHFAICSLYTSLKRERPVTSPCRKTKRKHNFDPWFI